MGTPEFRTARALYPHRPEMWQPEYLYESLPLPVEHPELDLFGQQRAVTAQEGAAPAPGLRPGDDLAVAADAEGDGAGAKPPVAGPAEPLPARMLNEFVYCQRLFYYEHVEGVFLKNADTERGAALHEKVDRGKGALPRARKKARTLSGPQDAPEAEAEAAATEQAEALAAGGTGEAEVSTGPDGCEGDGAAAPEVIHSRSAMMSSDRLGVVARMDVSRWRWPWSRPKAG